MGAELSERSVAREDSLSRRVERALEAFRPVEGYDLGVLFVHGMGEQSRGDTLTEAGDALVQWLERWCERPPHGTKLDPGDVHVVDASLRTEHDDELGMAHMTLRLTLPVAEDAATGRSNKVVHWVLAESWWAEGFRPATFNQVAGWVLGIGPWVLATQFQGLRDRMEMPAKSHWLMRLLLWPAAILTAGVLVAVAALVSLVLTLVAILVLVLRIIPIGPVQSLAEGIQRSLASSFGDLMVLVQSPSRFGAMRSQVRDDLEALTRKCDKVVVIAHSQGTHIAWEAIRHPTPGNRRVPRKLVRLFTYGQAMRKLKLAYEVSRHELNGGIGLVAFAAVAAQVALALLLAAGISAVVDGGRLVQDAVAWFASWSPADGPLLLGLLLAVVVGGNAVLLRRAGKEMEKVESNLLVDVGTATKGRSRFRWIDLWSSADPAPNGPLSLTATDQVESWRIRNIGSILLDHSIYWQNTTEFVGALAGELGRVGAGGGAHFPGDSDPFPSRRLRLAALTRGARVHVLTALRVMWAGAVLAYGALVFPTLQASITLDWVPDDVPLISLLGDWGPTILSVLVIGVAGLVGWVLIAKVWGAGVRADDRAYFAGRVETPFPWPTWGAIGLLLALAPMATFGLWLLADAPVLAAAYALSVPLVAMAVNTFVSGGGRSFADAAASQRLRLSAVRLVAAIIVTLVLALVARDALREGEGGALPIMIGTYLLLILPLLWATLYRWRGFLRDHRALRGELG